MNKLTIDEKIGQMLCFAFHGDSYNDQVKELVENIKVGGVIYFARNVKDNNQILLLNQLIQNSAKIPLFIGIDQEGGLVQRITKDITPLPGAMSLSATCQSNYEICKYVGDDLKRLGFNINFAPVADVNSNPYNPVINSRSYSDNPKTVSKYVNDAIDGFKNATILTTVKHFPGHGDTRVDSHSSLPVVEKKIEDLENIDIFPFVKAIEHGAEGIMLSHVLYTSIDSIYPASLSEKIITGLLKNKYHFKGLIVTDSLTMGAINNNYSKKDIIMNAVNAGVDLLIFCGKADITEQREIYNEFVNLVKEKRISIERIDESVNKILNLKEKYCLNNLVNKGNNQLEISHKIKLELAQMLSLESITLVENRNQLLPIQLDTTLILFPEIKIASLVDNDSNNFTTLGKFLKCDEIIYNDTLDNVDYIISKADCFNKIILCTYNVRENDYQTKLFSLLNTDKVIVVSMRSPYDYLYLDNYGAYICIYEVTSLAFKSLSQCLINNLFKGKLPIKKGEKKNENN